MTTEKLSDIQLVLLTSAACREDGSLLPPPDSVGAQAGRIRKTVTALLRRGFAEEFSASDQAQVWREGDGEPVGVRITAAGRLAIGMEPDESSQPSDTSPPPSGTKQSLVIAMLKREGGVSLPEVAEAAGWLPHTTRAAFSGLRKKGYAIERTHVDGASIYAIRS